MVRMMPIAGSDYQNKLCRWHTRGNYKIKYMNYGVRQFRFFVLFLNKTTQIN